MQWLSSCRTVDPRGEPQTVRATGVLLDGKTGLDMKLACGLPILPCICLSCEICKWINGSAPWAMRCRLGTSLAFIGAVVDRSSATLKDTTSNHAQGRLSRARFDHSRA